MQFATLMRIHPAAWLALPLILMSSVYAASYQPATTDPYSIALSAAGTVTLGLIAPVCAALGAWEAGRLQRAEWWTLPHVRSPLIVAAWALAPILVVGFLAVLSSLMLQLWRAGLIIPDPRLLGVALVVIAGHASAGFAIGIKLPVVLAAPGVLIASYLWMAFPRAMEPLWLRHLTGSLEACCLLHDDLAGSAVMGAGVLALGLLVASGNLIALGWRVRAIGISVATIATGSFLGVLLVSGLGAAPTVARDASELVCHRSVSIRICVWPEHAGRLGEVEDVLNDAAARWRAEGFAVPTTFTERDRAELTQGESNFGFSLASTSADILHGAAYGLLPPWPSCADVGPYPGAIAIQPVHAWFDATAGMERTDLIQRFPATGLTGEPSPLEIVEALTRASGEARAEWLATNLAALGRCDLDPVLLPS